MDNSENKVSIKDVLKLIKEIGLEETAKSLQVGRDRMRNFLKDNQCEHVRGTTEWLYKGDNPAFLSWNVYDHVRKTLRGTKPKSKQVINQANNKVINKVNNQSNKTDKKEVDNMENKQESNPVNNEEINQESNQEIKEEKKKVTYELPVSLHEEYRIKAIKERKTVSELVEMAMKQYL